MSNRFKLLLFVVLVAISTAALAQSAPEPAPTPDAAPAVAPAPEAPPSPAPAPAAKSAIPAKPATPPKPEASKPPTPPEPPRYFRLEYVLKQVESGKVVNSRSYSVIAAANREGREQQIRTGSRVPVPSAPSGSTNAQFQYMNVGVDIDTSLIQESQGRLHLRVAANINSIAGREPSGMPIIRQNKWEAAVVVPIGMPTVIFSSDDLASVGTTQLELKATPISTN